jgi:TolA-binding protein
MKKCVILFIILFMFFLIISQQGCSLIKKDSSGEYTSGDEQAIQEDYDEIERLLGIERGEFPREDIPAQESPAMDTQPESSSPLATSPSPLATAVSTEKRFDIVKTIGDLRRQIEALISESKKKDREIADLKAQLQSRESGSLASSQETNFPTGVPSAPGLLSRVMATPGTGRYASASYKTEYERGLSYFHQKQYNNAISVFEQLLAVDTQNDYSDNAQYWKGESYYALGKFQEAIMAFEKVFTYRFSNKNDYAQYKIAQCYYRLGNKQRAGQEFQAFLDNYPKSELVTNANRYLARL